MADPAQKEMTEEGRPLSMEGVELVRSKVAQMPEGPERCLFSVLLSTIDAREAHYTSFDYIGKWIARVATAENERDEAGEALREASAAFVKKDDERLRLILCDMNARTKAHALRVAAEALSERRRVALERISRIPRGDTYDIQNAVDTARSALTAEGEGEVV